TVRLAPENLTRAPFELGWSPSAASSTPSFASSSLYRTMSQMSFSSGGIPASESFVALRIAMNRMSLSPLFSGPGLPTLHRGDDRPGPESTPAATFFWRADPGRYQACWSLGHEALHRLVSLDFRGVGGRGRLRRPGSRDGRRPGPRAPGRDHGHPGRRPRRGGRSAPLGRPRRGGRGTDHRGLDRLHDRPPPRHGQAPPPRRRALGPRAPLALPGDRLAALPPPLPPRPAGRPPAARR